MITNRSPRIHQTRLNRQTQGTSLMKDISASDFNPKLRKCKQFSYKKNTAAVNRASKVRMGAEISAKELAWLQGKLNRNLLKS